MFDWIYSTRWVGGNQDLFSKTFSKTLVDGEQGRWYSFPCHMIHYTKSPSRSLSNLYVAKMGDVEVGFIHRPKNTKTDKNFWRAYFGIGESATFLGHSSTKQGAMVNLNWAIVGARAVVVQK